jgi:uncharacterized protein YutE (UPF0331/DUF86 family)
MVRPDKVDTFLRLLNEYTEKLRHIAQFSPDEFRSDFLKLESAKHLLQVAIECCLDASNHIIASEGFRSPQTYSESFVILAEQNIIPGEFLPRLLQMAKFRNRLVHLYHDLNTDELYRILHENLADFDTFASLILAFVESHK